MIASQKKSAVKNIKGLALLFAALLFLSGCQQELYSGLPEKDVNEMMSILMHSGIESGKVTQKKGLFGLSVEKKHLSEAIEILKDHGYPRQYHESMGVLFKKEGLISSPLEEKVRFIYALSQNVEETLTQIDGVITARVHVVLPENNPFADHIKPASASVFIKYYPDSKLEERKSDIKLIVEKSIEGLTYDKVSVVMLPAKKIGALANEQKPETFFGGFFKWLFAVVLIFFAILFSLKLLRRPVRPSPNKKTEGAAKPVGSPLLKVNPEEQSLATKADANASSLRA